MSIHVFMFLFLSICLSVIPYISVCLSLPISHSYHLVYMNLVYDCDTSVFTYFCFSSLSLYLKLYSLSFFFFVFLLFLSLLYPLLSHYISLCWNVRIFVDAHAYA